MAAAEQPARIEILAVRAEGAVHVGVLDQAIDTGGPDTGAHDRPHAELPIAHMHGDDEHRPHLVLVARDDMAVGYVQPVGLSDDAIDVHGLCLLYTSDAADDLLCVDLG